MKANYDLISDQWNSDRSSLPPKDQQLFDIFIKHLPNSCEILDIGCGSGFPIATLLDDKGYKISGVDRSTKLLRFAQEKLPQCKFINSDIEDFTFEKKYKGVVLWDILFHLDRSKHESILTNIFEHLEEKGIMILSSGGSKDDIAAFTDFMYGVKFFYDSYPVKAFKVIVEKIGFTVLSESILNIADGDRDKGRVGLILQK